MQGPGGEILEREIFICTNILMRGKLKTFKLSM